jgi:hypothetical protein
MDSLVYLVVLEMEIYQMIILKNNRPLRLKKVKRLNKINKMANKFYQNKIVNKVKILFY